MSARFCGVGTGRAQSLRRHALLRATRNAQCLSAQKESLRRRRNGGCRLREDKNLILVRRSAHYGSSSSHDGPEEDASSSQRPRSVRRVLLKISGEALQGDGGSGISPEILRSVAEQIAMSWKEKHQIAIVVGGGNFFRGADAFDGLDRVTADYVGMLATTMNAVCLQSMLENYGVPTRVQTAIEIREVAEPYIRRRAIRHLEKNRVVIFGAGTGSPFFTTDTAAVLRAAEIGADEILKATKVAGVFSSDPNKDSDAEFLQSLSYDRALTDGLQFMERTALSLCNEHQIPVRVFSFFQPGNIIKAIRGEAVGTLMRHDIFEEHIKKDSSVEPSMQQSAQNGCLVSTSV